MVSALDPQELSWWQVFKNGLQKELTDWREASLRGKAIQLLTYICLAAMSVGFFWVIYLIMGSTEYGGSAGM